MQSLSIRLFKPLKRFSEFEDPYNPWVNPGVIEKRNPNESFLTIFFFVKSNLHYINVIKGSFNHALYTAYSTSLAAETIS